MPLKRVCEGCGYRKDPSKYESRTGRYCDRCRRDPTIAKVKRRQNPRYHLGRYGLTPDTHAALITQQAGLCAICGSHPPKLVVCAIRPSALLCRQCSMGLGMFKGSVAICEAAADFLLTTK